MRPAKRLSNSRGGTRFLNGPHSQPSIRFQLRTRRASTSGRLKGSAYIDFNSQLMCVNIGHGDERVVRAIQEQAAVLPYANPFMATEVRARLGAKLAEITPGDIERSSSLTAARRRTRMR